VHAADYFALCNLPQQISMFYSIVPFLRLIVHETEKMNVGPYSIPCNISRVCNIILVTEV
jgi:hypothetical protein